MDDNFRRLSHCNVASARTAALRIAQDIDSRHFTKFSMMPQDKLMLLLRVRAVALRHFTTVDKVLEIIQRHYAGREAKTSWGVKFAVLVSDKALEFAHAELAQRPVRRVTSKSVGWTGQGLANLPREVLAGAVRPEEKTGPAVVKYPYRGRPLE